MLHSCTVPTMIVKNISTLLLLLGLVNLSLQDEESPKVNTTLGCITGYYKTSLHGKIYEAYEGIPYAEPPVGKLRFQPPQPVKSWGGDLSATKKGSVCTQYTLAAVAPTEDRVLGCEDCLYLNIYVPARKDSEKLLPVMFWIHGGAFLYGSGNEANETLIIENEVVFVTMNYRLGALGFLSTGDEVIPGNMGLKDQSLALRWVHDHIKNFGGDPNQVTIFGVSAGSASVHYQYLSNWSAGCFQRGISISGVALDPWALSKKSPEIAKKLGSVMGCSTASSEEMVNCLQNRPARLIAEATSKILYWLDTPVAPFAPVVEKGGDNPFISDTPANIIAKGEAADVPWITGVVSEEGLFPTAEFITNDGLLKQLNDDWDNIAPYLLNYYDSLPVREYKEVAEKARKHYLGSSEINKDSVVPLIYMIGDRLFSANGANAAKLQAKYNKSPVWFYLYSYRAWTSFSETLSHSTQHFGTCHSDDTLLVTDTTVLATTKSEDLKMQKLLLEFYTSFAIEGKPHVGNANWKPLKSDGKCFRYLHIDNPQNISMDSNDNFAQRKFWNSINFNENKVCQKVLEKKKEKH